MLRAAAVLVAYLLVAALPPTASAGLHHRQPVVYAVGEDDANPQDLAAGDFDGDGNLDVATVEANFGISDPTVSILYGTGDGRLVDLAIFEGDGVSRSLAVGDFDEDQLDDLLVALAGRSTVQLWLSDGQGGFDVEDHAITGTAESVVSGDFDNDGNVDAATSGAGGAVALLRGDGDGNLAAAAPYAAGNSGYVLAAGDVNGDTRDDLISVYGPVAVLLGNADGTLAAAVDTPYSICCTARAVTGRLNADARDDLVVGAGASGGLIDVLLGGTGATLGDPTRVPGADTGTPGLGDFDGNGRLDLVTASSLGDVAVALGAGDGTFGPRLTFEPGGNLSHPGGFDLDEDGFDDIVVLSHVGGPLGVGVALNAPAAAASPAALTFGTAATALTTTIANDGQPPLRLGQPSITGDADFTILGQTCAGAVLAAGAACSITVGFQPTAALARSATLVVPGNGVAGSLGIGLAGGAPQAADVPDTKAPTLRLRLRRQKLADALKRGVAATVTCDEACKIAARAILARKVARRLGLPGRRPLVAGRLNRSLVAGTTRIRVRLARRVRAKLEDVGSVKLSLVITVTDLARNADTVTRSLTLKR